MNQPASPNSSRGSKRRSGTRGQHLHTLLAAYIHVPLKRSGSHIIAIVMLLLMLSLVIHFVNQVLQSAHLTVQREELEAEVAQLEAETQHLLGAVEYVESDLYVERVAREELGYAREGETVVLPLFVAPTPTSLPKRSEAEIPPPPPPQPNWQGWWESFFPKGKS